MKGIKMLTVLLCSWYLPGVVADDSDAVENRKLKTNFKKVVHELGDRNIAVTQHYLSERQKTFFIQENLITERKTLIKEVMNIKELETGSEKTPEFTKSIMAIEELFSSLENNVLRKTAYETFLEKASKELLALKERQLQRWKTIKNALADYEPRHKKEKIDQLPEDKVYLDKYAEFVSDLNKFLNTTSDAFINLYKEYTYKSKLSAAEKVTLYKDISVFSILREMVSIIHNGIRISNENVFKKVAFDLSPIDRLEPFLFIRGKRMEAHEYAKGGDKFEDIRTIFDSLLENLWETEYYIIENILEVNIEKVQGSIRSNYDGIRMQIEKFKVEETSTEELPENIEDKLDDLLEYKEQVIDAVIKTIDSDTYTDEQKKANLNLFTLRNENHALPMRHKVLNRERAISWLGIQREPNVKDTTPIEFDNEAEWIKNMYIGLGANENERKDALEYFSNVLDNISMMFFMMYSKLSETSKMQNYLVFREKIEYSNKLTRALCYAAKLKKVKRAANCKVPLYMLSAANVIVSFEKSTNNQYPALNRKDYVNITNVGYIPAALRGKKTQQIIKYLQMLIKQLNRLSNKMSSLINETTLAEQNRLTEKLCSINVDQDIKPSKSFLLTEETRIEVKGIINMIENRLKQITEIKNKDKFYWTRQNMIMLDTALEILKEYIAKDAEETLEAFIEYKNEGILAELNKMREEERTENIRESKNAYVECENILLDANNEIPNLLSEIGNTNVRRHYIHLVNNNLFDPIVEPVE